MKERGFAELLLQYRKQIKYAVKFFLICCLPGLIFLTTFSRRVSGQEKSKIKLVFNNPAETTSKIYLLNVNNYYLAKENESIIKEDDQIIHNANFNSLYNKKNTETYDFINVSYKAGYLREIEEFYSLNSFYQNLKLIKRFSEKFQLTLIPALEYSQRQEDGLPDLYKWYDNTGLNAEIDFNEFNALSVFAAGSISDSTWTAYGASLKSTVGLEDLLINNYFIASYEYFYYWNQVAQNFVNDNLKITYSNFSISAGYFYGVVENNYVDGYDTKATNPNTSFSFEAGYKLSKEPAVNVGLQFNTRDFEYYSPLYYSPQDRKLYGINAGFFNMFTNYYIYFGSGVKLDNSDNFIWAVDFEGGYDSGNFSISAGLSRYNDPFYTNYNTFLNITKGF